MTQTALKQEGAVRPQETATAWLVKILTGPLLVILLLVHLIVNHYTGSAAGLMTYDDVIAYFSNPLIVLMEMVFLVTVVVHSLLGLRSVILDMEPSPGSLRVVNALLILLGAGSIVYGLWLALAIAGQAG